MRVNGQVVWQNPAGNDLVDSSWVPVSLDISPQAAGNPAVQVEFRLRTNDAIASGTLERSPTSPFRAP